MAKPFKSIEEQYSLLLSRGITFSDEENAKLYLLRNNYYNTLNCYGKFFTTSHDTYINGTSFDEITQVQYFDKELKSILFKYFLEAEKHFKSLVAYYFSEAHKDQPYSYLIATNFKNDDILKVAPLISIMSGIISKYRCRKNPNAIKHYINRHKDVPLWVLCNYMTFGQTVNFFKHMNLKEQNKVAKSFGKLMSENLEKENIKLQANELEAILDNVLEVRNIVAHNNRVLGFKCKNNLPYISELHDRFSIAANQPRQDIYNIYVVMRCLLTKNQFAIMHNSIRSRVRLLNKKLHTISCNKIMDSLGFPKDWYCIETMNQD